MFDEERKVIQIQVHPDLIREFNLLKELLEKRTGYPIKGGNPTVSKIVAALLRKRRESSQEIEDTTSQIRLEVHKVKGVKKSEIFFL